MPKSPPPKQEQKPVASAPPKPTPETKPPEKAPEKPPAAQSQTQAQAKPQTEKPAEPAPVSKPSAQTPPPAAKPAETRDRSVYLIQGTNMAPVKVNRKLTVSDSPLLDSLNALLSGPTADERKRGLASYVPEGAKLIKPPIVRGSTVYLDFNEEFRYNSRGREGSEAQIKQIVWTATEFSNVKDVQILIEGERVDFLSEGVMIGSPIGR
jgi:spore germination protein GerM